MGNNIQSSHEDRKGLTLFYTCFVSLDPPEITPEGHFIAATEGSPVSISCPIVGNPTPNIVWYKGNDTSTIITYSSSTLEFSKTVLNNSGWYTCFAQNTVGSVTARIQLLVGRCHSFVK